MNDLHYSILIQTQDGVAFSSNIVAKFKYQLDAYDFAEQQFNYYSRCYDKVTIIVYKDDETKRKYVKTRV